MEKNLQYILFLQMSSHWSKIFAIQSLFFKISLIIIYLLFIIIQETWLIPQIILK